MVAHARHVSARAFARNHSITIISGWTQNTQPQRERESMIVSIWWRCVSHDLSFMCQCNRRRGHRTHTHTASGIHLSLSGTDGLFLPIRSIWMGSPVDFVDAAACCEPWENGISSAVLVFSATFVFATASPKENENRFVRRSAVAQRPLDAPERRECIEIIAVHRLVHRLRLCKFSSRAEIITATF